MKKTIEPKPIEGKELSLKEGDENTVIHNGREIERGDMPGDAYAAKVEKEIKAHLKTCINCAYFEFTPLSVNMGYAYKGKCAFPKNHGKAGALPYYAVPIFHLCEYFKFVPLKDRIERMKEKLNAFHNALGGDRGGEQK